MAAVKRTEQRPAQKSILARKKAGFRPGSSGVCEAQLWKFVGPRLVPEEDEDPVEWIAAGSLDQALKFMRRHHPDFIIVKVTAIGMINILSGSPLG